MLCYAMLCYAMLRYAMLCRAVPPCAVLHCAMLLWYAMLWHRSDSRPECCAAQGISSAALACAPAMCAPLLAAACCLEGARSSQAAPLQHLHELQIHPAADDCFSPDLITAHHAYMKDRTSDSIRDFGSFGEPVASCACCCKGT